MHRRVVVWLAVLVAIIMVMGLDASGQSTAQAPPPDAKPGGKLVLGFQYEPVHIDPNVTGQANAIRIVLNVVDGLVYIDQEGNVKPMLAERWRISPNGKIYTFFLRKGIKFHDGTPFNAQAVKFSLDRVADPATASQGRGALGPYEKSEVVDDYTVRITLKEAFAPFMINLGPGVLSPVSPTAVQKLGKDFGRAPVGTGAFSVKEWKAKDHITLVRNPDWKLGPLTNRGAAYLEEITIKFIPEDAVRAAVLETGEVDAIEDVPAQNVADFKKNPNRYTVYQVNFPGSPRQAMINTQKAPTNELNVRRAILHATNVEALNRTLYFNVYPVGNGIMSAATPMAIKGQFRQAYSYDQARARALLEEGGWRMGADGVREKGGQKLRVGIYILTDIPAFRPMVEFIQANLKEVGFDAFIWAQSRSPWFAALGNGEHHLAPMGLWSPDPDMMRLLYHSQGGSFSWSFYKNPELDKLVEDGIQSSNPKLRQQYYVKAQEILMRDAVTLPIHEQVNIFAIKAQYKGLGFNVNAYPVYYDMYVKR